MTRMLKKSDTSPTFQSHSITFLFLFLFSVLLKEGRLWPTHQNTLNRNLRGNRLNVYEHFLLLLIRFFLETSSLSTFVCITFSLSSRSLHNSFLCFFFLLFQNGSLQTSSRLRLCPEKSSPSSSLNSLTFFFWFFSGWCKELHFTSPNWELCDVSVGLSVLRETDRLPFFAHQEIWNFAKSREKC